MTRCGAGLLAQPSCVCAEQAVEPMRLWCCEAEHAAHGPLGLVVGEGASDAPQNDDLQCLHWKHSSQEACHLQLQDLRHERTRCGPVGTSCFQCYRSFTHATRQADLEASQSRVGRNCWQAHLRCRSPEPGKGCDSRCGSSQMFPCKKVARCIPVHRSFRVDTLFHVVITMHWPMAASAQGAIEL
jgi:hypothetical protein